MPALGLMMGREDDAMELSLWIPVLIVLGLIVFGLLFAFVAGCDKV